METAVICLSGIVLLLNLAAFLNYRHSIRVVREAHQLFDEAQAERASVQWAYQEAIKSKLEADAIHKQTGETLARVNQQLQQLCLN